MDAQPLNRQSDAVPARDDAKAQKAAAEDTMTPKGTLLILLLYAGAIVVLWGYVYISMLVRR